MSSVNYESIHPSSLRKGSDIRFPYGTLFGWLIALVFGGMFVYRLSEMGGKPSQVACLSAMGISFLAAFVGLIPVYKAWGKDLLWLLVGVFLSSVIRLLIGLVGAVIIILFADSLRTQFVGFLGLFYVAFLAIDTWLALWILRNTKVDKEKDQEAAIHGNIWDIISRHRKSA